MKFENKKRQKVREVKKKSNTSKRALQRSVIIWDYRYNKWARSAQICHICNSLLDWTGRNEYFQLILAWIKSWCQLSMVLSHQFFFRLENFNFFLLVANVEWFHFLSIFFNYLLQKKQRSLTSKYIFILRSKRSLP